MSVLPFLAPWIKVLPLLVGKLVRRQGVTLREELGMELRASKGGGKPPAPSTANSTGES